MQKLLSSLMLVSPFLLLAGCSDADPAALPAEAGGTDAALDSGPGNSPIDLGKSRGADGSGESQGAVAEVWSSPAALSSGTVATLSFGSVALGSSSAAQGFTITNTGLAASSAITLHSDNGEFAIQSGTTGGCVSGNTILAAGAFCTVSVVFTPAGTGDRTGAINFSAVSGGKGSVAVVGTVVASTVSNTLAILAGSPNVPAILPSSVDPGGLTSFASPSGVAVDGAGNVLVADTGNSAIRKVLDYSITTLAATNLSSPSGVAVDGAGNIFVADSGNHAIHKITPAGAVTALAGKPGSSGGADGVGAAATFNQPFGVAVDGAGNVFVADTGNHSIRKITPAGVVTTPAGAAGSSGSADGTGTAATFNHPSGVAVDWAGNVFVADTGNHSIRKITPAGAVTTLAGSPSVAGSADGTGTAATFNHPSGVAVDGAGNVFVADTGNHSIRKITPAGAVTTLAGSPGAAGNWDGTGAASTFAARFDRPTGLAVDGLGNVFVADTGNNTIRKITPAGTVTTLAGSPSVAGSADGTGPGAHFAQTSGVAVDEAGNAFVADMFNHTIRKITPAGAVTTLAGSPGSFGTADGTGAAARFFYPRGVAVDGVGNVFVVDSGNYTIRKITPAGAVTTLAGSPGSSGSADGTGTAARFAEPEGLAVDGTGTLFVADAFDNTIRKITPAGVVTTFAGRAGGTDSADGTGAAARFASPAGVAVDRAGNVFVADSRNFTIRKISPAGTVTTIAGTPGLYGSVDGNGAAARFYDPFGIAVDGAGNVFVAEPDSNTIRKITPAGAVSTVVGVSTSTTVGNVPGPLPTSLWAPRGVAVSPSTGNLYITVDSAVMIAIW